MKYSTHISSLNSLTTHSHYRNQTMYQIVHIKPNQQMEIVETELGLCEYIEEQTGRQPVEELYETRDLDPRDSSVTFFTHSSVTWYKRPDGELEGWKSLPLVQDRFHEDYFVHPNVNRNRQYTDVDGNLYNDNINKALHRQNSQSTPIKTKSHLSVVK